MQRDDRAQAGATPIRASVVVVTTNELPHLKELMPTLTQQTFAGYEVLVVDNGSTDGGPEFVEREFPSVRVLRNGANLGFVKANHRGFAEARGEILVPLNPDTRVEPEWLEELLGALDEHPEAGLSTSRICLFDDPDRINTCGNDVHVTGLAFCRGLGEPRERHEAPGRVPAVSGCAFAIRRSVLEEIGGFDEDFFLYLEDTDLSVRANLAGHQIRYAPRSIVYHKYRLKLGARKFFFLERNRLVMLLKNYRARTIVLLLPALALAEAIVWVYAATHGRDFLFAKARSYGWLLLNWRGVARRRASVQALRRVGDDELLRLFTWRVPFEQLTGSASGSAFLGWLANQQFRLARGVARALAA